MKHCFWAFLWVLWAGDMFAQQADSLPQQSMGFRKTSLFPLPIVYYTPETGWAGGLALFAAFRMPGQGNDERPSQMQPGFAYTQRRQILFYLPFQFFWNKERNQIAGELGFYRYAYLFYGIGNSNPKTNEEIYQVDFPRLRLNVLRLVAPKHYVGLRYWWDDYQIRSAPAGGQLTSGTITGSQGGVISGLGLLYNFDSRDDIFYPQKGFLIEGECFLNRKWLGSDFNFSRWSVDAAGYFKLRSSRSILALNVWITALAGEVPFQQLAFLGGSRKMRGHFEGRQRDRSLWTLQAEYRYSLRKRFGVVLFSGIGAVAPQMSAFFRQKTHISYGTGIRLGISKRERVNIRLDFAGNEYGELATYLTVKEAF
ncbi:MAG TPA: BamA/TamA family outer membrane protein [Saprospiraceae bacterium]|nr:BamA/TamA family outer membrane protein [Saprospiraceae bacterium]